MTAPPQQNGAGIVPGGTTQEDPAIGINALLRAIRVGAENAAGDTSAAEYKDHAQGALLFAQALVVLDPSLSQGGTPLEHDVALEQIRGQTQQNVASIQGETQKAVAKTQGEHQLRAAKETAAAPTPSRTKVATVRRDQHGRMQSASVTES